ncbi:barrier-to-autointegration factor-like [Haliotis asinina]|uniref:barrier-to-autointegration factor-like n=1 Tax=Haliotis asinina TaxID=109174 RepID=UPI003531D4C6
MHPLSHVKFHLEHAQYLRYLPKDPAVCLYTYVFAPPNQVKASGGMATQKHRDFVSEPMGQKPVTDLPGIGRSLGDELREAGFPKARNVLGKFLEMNQDRNRFKRWLQSKCRANESQAQACYMALKTWCDSHI